MANDNQSLSELRELLDAIEADWNAIEAKYDDPDPLIGISDDDWTQLTELSHIINGNSEHRTFAQAWADTIIAARILFATHVTAWSARLVEQFGIDRFPPDLGDPPTLAANQSGRRQESLPQRLTGSGDTVVAGLKLIVWAAAYRIPAICRRSPEFSTIIWIWVENLIEFGGGVCRTRQEPFGWAWQAVEHLASLSQADDACWSVPDSPSEWAKVFEMHWDTLKPLLDAQEIRNRKLTSKSYRVHFSDLPPDYKTKKDRPPEATA